MHLIRGLFNRVMFYPMRFQFKKCGDKVLFESSFEVEGAKYISVGNYVRVKPRLHLAAISEHNGISYKPEVIIGDNVSINYDVHIACINRIVIGAGTLLGSKILITDHFHGDTSLENLQIPPSERLLSSKGPIVIGENVWIGEGVAIMPGVTIGNNSIIGANSVVTSDIPEFCVAAGTPAKVVKQYEYENKGGQK